MVPVEVDELYRGIQNLTDALGPNGANKPATGEQEGALTKLTSVGADNLEGNGAKLGETIEQLSKASKTLAGSSGDIVSTIKNLDVFVGALRENDAQVRQFNTQMASFSKYMVSERDQLGQALNKLSYALGDVATFLDDNEAKIGKTVRDLQPTTKALLDEKDNLEGSPDAAAADDQHLDQRVQRGVGNPGHAADDPGVAGPADRGLLGARSRQAHAR